LTKLIQSGRSVEKTVQEIRNQGGFVYAPHPFAYVWKPNAHAQQALDEADVVEVFNSRAFLPVWNRRAAKAAHDRCLPAAASTDAHFPWEFGRAYTELPAFSNSDGFKTAIKEARPVGNRKGSPWLHVASRLIAEARRVAPGLGRSNAH
jgi:predicted metal-dependent phosphoesterase TrpH